MVDVITQHIDVWTSALMNKSTAGRGTNGKQTAYGIKKLRELILELAVRGLLVPQDPNDEPASVLLEKIAEEKARLVEGGKINRQQSVFISQEEIPYELPSNWEWARFPDICNYKTGKTPSTKNPVYWSDDADGIPWVAIADMEHFGRIENTNKKITQEAVNQVFKHEAIPAGSLLMSFKLTVGKITILEVDAFHNEAIISIQPFTGISRDYLFNFLPTRALEGNTKRAIMGNTLNANSLSLLLIPVPPLAEQHRIVAKVDELMALCDRLEEQQTDSNAAHQTLVEMLLATLTNPVHPELVEGCSNREQCPSTGSGQTDFETNSGRTAFEAAWQRIAEHFDTLFTTEHSIDQLKQTILQLAVMGNLVPQDPNDEPASVLLEKIAGEKARLVKEGKIKKQTLLPEISEDEKTFSLPMGWEWTRWDYVAMKIGDIDHKMPEQVTEGIPYVSPRDFFPDNKIDFDGAKKISFEDFQRLSSKIQPQRDDIIYPRYGTIGENRLVVTDKDFLASYSCCVIKTLRGFISPKYQFIFSMSEFTKQQAKKAENKTTQANVGINSIQRYLIPLPPLAEQHRIVAKVDELMTLCDTLKARIKLAQTTQIHLADTIVEQAVA